jgi:hypothetical protein
LSRKAAEQNSARLPLARRKTVLKTIVFILVALWLIGFALHVAGAMIHILLGLALVVLVIDLLQRRPNAT